MLVINLRRETLIKLLKLCPLSPKFRLTQNKFEKLNYVELYIRDLLSNTRIGFSQNPSQNLFFSLCLDLLAKQIQLKFHQVKNHISYDLKS